MASTCSCGCGREIKGIRRKANNVAARQIAGDLAVLRGALEHDDVGEQRNQVTGLVSEGAALLDSITAYLHDEADRDDVDKRATKAWLDEAGRLADSLVGSASGPAWEPDDPTTAHLALSGARATGVITDVRRDGLGNERVADLEMTASVRSEDGSTFEVTRSLSIAVVKAPRVGDRVEIAYDADDRNRFVYRPSLELP